jgi:chromosome segregation ATPase
LTGDENSGSESPDAEDRSKAHTPVPPQDSGLEHEAQMVKLLSEIETLKTDKKQLQKENTDLSNRLGRLQVNHESMQNDLRDMQDRSSSVKGASRGEDAAKIKTFELKLHDQEEYIADLENKLDTQQRGNQSLQKAVDQSQHALEQNQRLKDQLDELKVANDDLEKRSNAMEKYKQKAVMANNLEAERNHLQKELEEIRIEAAEGQTARDENPGLKQTIEQYKNILGKSEQHITDVQGIRKVLELELESIREQLGSARDRIASDAELLQDLQTSKAEGDDTPTGATTNGTLDAELTAIDNPPEKDKYVFWNTHDLERSLIACSKSELSKLKLELQALKDTGGAGAQNIVLKNLLEDAETSNKKFKQNYLEVQQKLLLLEKQFEAAKAGMVNEGYVRYSLPSDITDTYLDLLLLLICAISWVNSKRSWKKRNRVLKH